MSATRKEREEFIATMSRELPDLHPEFVATWCAQMMRLSATHCRLQEDACNVEMDDRQQARHDAQDERCEARITRLAQDIKARPIFAGDPRGCTVKLSLPSGKTNDWGKEGICVPQ